jgi:plastocyanin
MRFAIAVIGIGAVLGCDEGTPTPAPSTVPPPAADMATAPTPTSTDMAMAAVAHDMAAPPAAQDMAKPPQMFPTSAAVTVGPNGTLTYSPSAVDIAAGGTVNWTWAGGLSHSVTSDTGVFDSGIKASGAFSFTFPNAGSFPYHCMVHGTIMSGTVMVH